MYTRKSGFKTAKDEEPHYIESTGQAGEKDQFELELGTLADLLIDIYYHRVQEDNPEIGEP